MGVDKVFVDTGAWVALAVVGDPYHERTRAAWEDLTRKGARLLVSLPVILETFTFLDRRGSRELALRWQRSLKAVPRLSTLDCSAAHLVEAWALLERRDMAKLGIVDATTFVIMKRLGIHAALAFDRHFAQAGFKMIG